MDLDAERAVLASIIIDNHNYYEVTSALTPDHFSLDSHRRIAAAMIDMVSGLGLPVDYVTLTGHLSDRKELEAVGGAAYVCYLHDQRVKGANLKTYIKRVREKYLLRQVTSVF